jgi:hypothetical protein
MAYDPPVSMRTSRRRATGSRRDVDDRVQQIEITLDSADEMFVIAPADHFSEFRNFMTGLEYSISVLRSRPSSRPVVITVRLPEHEITEGIEAQLSRTMGQYCEHRISYNRREARAVRLDGFSAMKVGLPVAIAGGLVALLRSKTLGGIIHASEIAGGVVMWVGLWYPLDTIFFTPLGFSRENAALGRLRDATFVVEPRTSLS